MPLDLVDGRGKGVVIAVYGVLGILLCRDGHDVRPLGVQLAERLSDLRVVGDGLGDDVGRARERLLHRIYPLLGIDVVLCRLLGRGTVGRLCIQEFRKRRKALFARDRGARAALLLIGTVDVLDLGERLCLADGMIELFRHLPLVDDGSPDFLPPRLQVPEVGKAVGKAADGLVVHRAVHLLAVARDEGHRVALVQQGDDILHIVLALSEFFGQDLTDRLHEILLTEYAAPSECGQRIVTHYMRLYHVTAGKTTKLTRFSAPFAALFAAGGTKKRGSSRALFSVLYTPGSVTLCPP